MGSKGGAWGARVGHGEQGWGMGSKGGAWGARVGHGEQGWGMGSKGGVWGARVGYGEQGWGMGSKGGAWGARVGLYFVWVVDVMFLHIFGLFLGLFNKQVINGNKHKMI